MFSKKTIMKKTLAISGFTWVSRCLGIARDILLMRYLGYGVASDAFVTAYKIPNSLRKIFAEGALSAVFIPVIVRSIKATGQKSINDLMTFGFVVFEGIVLLVCAWVMLYAELVISWIAPGFSVAQVQSTIPCLQIVMPFIFFISSSALLAGVLQSVDHFFVPAFAPILLNMVFISSILICDYFILPVESLCWFIIGGGALQLLSHLAMYFKLGFGFGRLRVSDFKQFSHVLVKFFPCLLGMGVMEIGLFVDQYFTSFLPAGSTSLHSYAGNFLRLPLGIFGVAFSTVLLPHFSRVADSSPRRLQLYVLEAAKLIFWVMFPMTLIMSFFAENIFITMFLSEKFTMLHVQQAAHTLQAFLVGLFFFAFNKILLNVYYALHDVWHPAYITIAAVASNAVFNSLLVGPLALPGIALATSFSEILRTILFLIVLVHQAGVNFNGKRFITFAACYSMQVMVLGIPFVGIYRVLKQVIMSFPISMHYFLLQSLGFWLWVGPLLIIFFTMLWLTRNYFNVKLYFLEH